MIATAFDKLSALTLGHRTVAERRRRLAVVEQEVEGQSTMIRQYLERFDEMIDDLRRLHGRSKQLLLSMESRLRTIRDRLTTDTVPDRKLERIHDCLSRDYEAMCQKTNRQENVLREREANRRQIARRLNRAETRIARKLVSVRLQLGKETSVRGVLAKSFDTLSTLVIANQIRKHLFADADQP